MTKSIAYATTALAFAGILIVGTLPATGAEPDTQTMIRAALSAAPPEVAKTATVMTMDQKVLRQGTGDYTCFPPAPDRARDVMLGKGARDAMCLDKVWLGWVDAFMNKKPFKAEKVGTAYMLAGDNGASNIDPYAKGPTADNQWVVEGPHVMVLVPDPAQLEGVSTDPNNGGAYVMWKGSPYAHIMLPVAARPAAQKAATQ